MNYMKFFKKWLLLPCLLVAMLVILPPALSPALGPVLGVYTSYGVTFLICIVGLYFYRKSIKKKDRE